jgi:hypothetical protein
MATRLYFGLVTISPDEVQTAGGDIRLGGLRLKAADHDGINRIKSGKGLHAG